VGPVAEWVAANTNLMLFIHALANFVVALVTALAARGRSKLSLAGGLWFLTGFALLRSVAWWVVMLLRYQTQVVPPGDPVAIAVVKAVCLPLSGLCLLLFGVTSIIAATRRHRWLRWVAPAQICALVAVLVAEAYALAGDHLAWLSAVDLWTRYLLYLPGLALSTLGFLLHSRVFREAKLPHIARDCVAAAVPFGVRILINGLLLEPGPAFMGPILHNSFAVAVLNPSVELLRVATALGIAFFVLRIMDALAVEQTKQLDLVTQQHIQAQREAFEAQNRACEELQQWSAQLEDVVNTMAGTLGQPSDGASIAQAALRKVLKLTGLDVGWIQLADKRQRELALVAYVGLTDELAEGMRRFPGMEEIGLRVVASGEPVILEDVGSDAQATGTPTREHGIRALAVVPVKSRETVLGTMSLAAMQPRRLTLHEGSLLAAVGQQIGVAIENARLYEQVQSIAALEERDRLGRELHDGLAQVIGYWQLQNKTLEKLLSEGKVSQAIAEVREMQEVAQEAYTGIRESILGLRTTLSPATGLVPTLLEYIHTFGQQSGINARLVMADGTRLELAPSAEIQLLRIIQEALTNVRKHSGASRAWVRVGAEDEQAVVVVEDDGRGFDPAQVRRNGAQHFGLETMRERAESAAGTLQLSSRPGEGTRVLIRLPFARRCGRSS